MKTYKQKPNHSKNPKRITHLEDAIKTLTPKHINLVNPSFNPKLMQAHYLLALQHLKDGNKYEAMPHFNKANYEFNNALINEHEIRNKEATTIIKNKEEIQQEQNNRFEILRKYKETLNNVSKEIYKNGIDTSFYFQCNPLFAALRPKTKKEIKTYKIN